MDDKEKKIRDALDALSRLVGFDVSDDAARPGDGSLERRYEDRKHVDGEDNTNGADMADKPLTLDEYMKFASPTMRRHYEEIKRSGVTPERIREMAKEAVPIIDGEITKEK